MANSSICVYLVQIKTSGEYFDIFAKTMDVCCTVTGGDVVKIPAVANYAEDDKCQEQRGMHLILLFNCKGTFVLEHSAKLF